jgi:hypothetical protein
MRAPRAHLKKLETALIPCQLSVVLTAHAIECRESGEQVPKHNDQTQRPILRRVWILSSDLTNILCVSRSRISHSRVFGENFAKNVMQ